MARQPDAEPAPADGALPASALEELPAQPFGWYIHVPYCRVRCGYCDFNTYLASAMPAAGQPDAWEIAIHREIDLARKVLGDRDVPVSTVFFGGGTPTLVPPRVLTGIIGHLCEAFGLLPDAEVTTEANPETIGMAELEALRAGGINRLSVGMQSADEQVLAVLDRMHTSGRVEEVVDWARRAGFDQISLDLIYGTPGESDEDWMASLEAVVAMHPDHVSAYALTVEPGTAMGRRVTSGELPDVDPDVQADRYLMAEERLVASGYLNYEISNWALGQSSVSRHNLGYWRGYNWWGAGPGAHSHIGGVRWWNVRHPARYAALLNAGKAPAEARETLSAQERRLEHLFLGIRTIDGLTPEMLTASEWARLDDLVARGLIVADDQRVVLTLAGRLLADAVVRDLLD